MLLMIQVVQLQQYFTGAKYKLLGNLGTAQTVYGGDKEIGRRQRWTCETYNNISIGYAPLEDPK